MNGASVKDKVRRARTLNEVLKLSICRQVKVDWLLANPGVWEGFPRADVFNHHRKVFKAMRAAGLYARSTQWLDAGIDEVISEARRQRRDAQL